MGEAPNTTSVCRRWSFATAVFDEARRSLTVGGELIRLEPKPLELLQHLLLNAGKVQTKDELLEAVWPGRILTETVLTKAIGRLRQVLNDDDQAIIVTEYKYGYCFAAKVDVEWIAVQAGPAPPPGLAPGDRPPLRPVWRLERRLGTGGQGDVWIGIQEKTGERRVFKFALDAEALSGLKREITLFRLLQQTLGSEAPVVRLIDWNLEVAPYFIESEWIERGSLADWLSAQGGPAAMPMSDRLELTARIADALARIHQVGVLHKDLKPANVLLGPDYLGVPQVLLGDLGSGGVLDAEVLQRLKITQMATIAAGLYTGPSSATPLYLAPEVLAGQPSTIKSDIYALGVMLYQVAAGDLSKPWMPGWERDIPDEMLREDVASAADGEPARRCRDAGVLAESLRTLDRRRAQREAELQARQKAAEAERALERMRARRNALALALSLFVVGSAVSTWLYFQANEARAQADKSAARARAVSEYLSKDLFAPINDRNEPVMYMSVEQFLQTAADNVDKRLVEDPAVAAEVHAALGNSFVELHRADQGAAHLRRALEMSEQLEGPGAAATLRNRDQLIQMDWVLGKLRGRLLEHEAALQAGVRRLGADSPYVRAVQVALAKANYWLGNWPRAETDLLKSLANELSQPQPDPEHLALIELELGRCQYDLDNNADAEATLRSAIAHFTQAHNDIHIDTARARVSLGLTLISLGKLEQAQTVLDRALEDSLRWSTERTWHVANSRYAIARLRNEQGHPEQAEAPLTTIVRSNELDNSKVDQSGPVKQTLGDVLLRLGKAAEAEVVLRRGVANAKRDFGEEALPTRAQKVQLAEILALQGRGKEAGEVLSRTSAVQFDELLPTHPLNLRLDWTRALVMKADGDVSGAIENLHRSLLAHRARYGESNWRTRRIEVMLTQHAN